MKFKIPYFIFCICLSKLCCAQNNIQVTIDSIPKHIKHKINRNYIGYKINYCAKTTDSLNQLSYTIILIKASKQIDVKYNANGKLISKQKATFYTGFETKNEQNFKTPFPNL